MSPRFDEVRSVGANSSPRDLNMTGDTSARLPSVRYHPTFEVCKSLFWFISMLGDENETPIVVVSLRISLPHQVRCDLLREASGELLCRKRLGLEPMLHSCLIFPMVRHVRNIWLSSCRYRRGCYDNFGSVSAVHRIGHKHSTAT
jgi:hypothetical protein